MMFYQHDRSSDPVSCGTFSPEYVGYIILPLYHMEYKLNTCGVVSEFKSYLERKVVAEPTKA